MTIALFVIGAPLFAWWIWFLAPLGDPETGAGAFDREFKR